MIVITGVRLPVSPESRSPSPWSVEELDSLLPMRDTLIFIVILSVIVVATFALVFLECRVDTRGGGGLGVLRELSATEPR